MNRRRYRLLIGIALGLALVVLVSMALAQNGGYSLDWWTADGGGLSGAVSQDGAYTLGGTAGQPDAGTLQSADGRYTLHGGFWGGSGPTGQELFLPAIRR